MTNVQKLLQDLETDEGIRLKPYQDSLGVLTIGVGRNLRDRGISRDEAHYLLANDVEGALADLDTKTPWWRKLDEVRQRVLANMCFNLGIARLLGFKNTLHLVETGQYATAADAMLDSAWAKQVGQRAIRLAQEMRDGGVR